MLSLVRQRLDGTVAALCRERGGSMHLMFVDAEEPGFDEDSLFPAGHMFCCTVLGAEGPLSCAHIGESEWRAHPAYASLGMESFIGIQITVAREPFGSACVWARRPRRQGFDDGDRDVLRQVSMWIGAELEREDTTATLRSVHAELEERVAARTEELTVANQRLRLSEERLRHAVSVGRLGLWERDLRTGEVEWDQRLREMLGAPMEGPVDSSSWYWERLEPDDRLRIKALIRQAETGGGDYRYECRYQRLDGRTSWLGVSGGARIGDCGEPTHLAGMTVDVTARKEAEAELQRMTEELDRRVARRTADLDESRQRLRALLGELTMAEERERRRLADELHDGLTQLLTLGRMNLARATRLLDGDSQPNQPALDLLQQIRATLDTSIVYTRTLIGELSPRVLYDFGLPVALQWLGDQMKPHGLDVTVTIDEVPLSLNDTQSVLLFQAVRELLWNVLKHAESPHADVRLRADDTELQLEVEDAGKGFSERSSPAGGGFGLLSIRERLAMQSGSIDIRSEAGQGTRITIRLPLNERTAGETSADVPAAHPQAEPIPVQDAPSGAGASP